MKRVHVFISGLVQGVFFRNNAQEQAVALGVDGWICNLADGRVEAIFEGEDERVNALMQWCNKGPNGARVDKVEVKEEECKDEFKDFKIRF
ncbi:MAG: acylphosphatase [Candidatus Diapherotrites archaeon]|nr:acylphosphatase [Candidatus Diapherotrites archaeon]